MKKLVVTGIVAAGLVLGGTSFVGASMNDKSDDVKADVSSEEVVKSKDVSETKEVLPLAKIKEIALAEHEGHIDDIDLEIGNGYTYYEVDIENGEAEYEVYIDAHTGDVLTVEVDGDDDAEKRQALENIIPMDEAKAIAVKQVGGKVVEIELDEDDNRFEYEMELRTDLGEVEITIDAVTGEVLEQELDD